MIACRYEISQYLHAPMYLLSLDEMSGGFVLGVGCSGVGWVGVGGKRGCLKRISNGLGITCM